MLAQCKARVGRCSRSQRGRPDHVLPALGPHRRPLVLALQPDGLRARRSPPCPTRAASPRCCRQVKPTIWGAVPRVLEKIKAALEAGIAAEPDEARREGCARRSTSAIKKVRLEQAGEEVPEELAAAYKQADEMALSKLRAKLGLDEARWIIVGAAPVPRDVHEFLLALGLPVTEIYGMSECSCVRRLPPRPAGAKIGSVGPALPGVEVSARRRRRVARARPHRHEGLPQPAREDRRGDRRRRLDAHRRHRDDRRRRLRPDRRPQEGADHQRGRQEHVAGQHRERAQGRAAR